VSTPHTAQALPASKQWSGTASGQPMATRGQPAASVLQAVGIQLGCLQLLDTCALQHGSVK
jgi:hypothetical protein